MPIRERIEDQTVEPQIAEVMRHASRKARDVLRLNADPDDADRPRRLKKYIDRALAWAREASAPGLHGVVAAVVLVILTDTILVGLRYIQELPPVSITFLLVILIAAIRWGMLAGTVTAIGGIISFISFFYSPFYTYDPQDRSRFLSILFFLIVALIISYLAARTRRAAAAAVKRENEIRELYTFSQRLSATNSPAAIFDAMQRHLETLVGHKVLLFDSRGTLDDKSERLDDIDIPKAVTESVGRTQAPGPEGSKGIVLEDGRGSAWLVRPVSVNTADFGVIAVDLGRKANRFNDLRTRVVAVINDAACSLERLGLARTIADARMRAKTEEFREALIGSVSHELRTPLASILGASTVLSVAPEITANARLESLAVVIHHESERLNVEIQNILDASRITRDGLQAKLEWSEPADFVNSALERCRHRLAKHTVEINMPDELVLLHIDSVLMERALAQVLDNAAKYSPEGSAITVQGRRETDSFVLTVTDRGAGLDWNDRSLLGQKFFRGKRHAQSTSGLGLGFWIASAFVAANQGIVEAVSEGVDRGMVVKIRLPLSMKAAA
jgi:two-component system, OmpR family, sensor histidine kinase KdpD